MKRKTYMVWAVSPEHKRISNVTTIRPLPGGGWEVSYDHGLEPPVRKRYLADALMFAVTRLADYGWNQFRWCTEEDVSKVSDAR
jgi:hypothetical protein